ncbi:MAG: hypothetical protein WCJ61_01205, partial [Paludibacter sp.]
MKVFAEFFEENDIQYRTKTLLQFGNSWDLIGTIVMKNPGKAFPTNKIEENLLVQIKGHFSKLMVNETNWFEFNSDSTMRQVENLFNGYYIGKSFELNGVIQIFNLFNIRERKIEIAKELLKNNNSKYLYPNNDEVINSFQNKPVYLSFGWEYINVNEEQRDRWCLRLRAVLSARIF